MIEQEFEDHIRVAEETKKLSKSIEKISQVLGTSITAGGKILICGNGGSAADAQHFAAELVGRYLADRKALPALALTTDTSALTAIGNDYGFEQVFSRQVEALGRKGDVLVLISTSGNSENLLKAAAKAKDLGLVVVALLGKGGGKLKSECHCHHVLVVPSDSTPRVQEMHALVIHAICGAVEVRFTQKHR